ncbi:hypothetical protein [Angustibacter aerolatus]
MTGPSRAPAVGYRLVLPPGWMQLPVRDPATPDRVEARLREAAAGQPRDAVEPLLAEAARRVRDLLAEGRAAGALDPYAPLLGVRGRPVPASFVVHDQLLDGEPPGGFDVTEGVLAAMLRAHPEAAPVALDGATALRWEVESPAGPEGDPPAAKRVEVHVPVPGDERRWLSVVLTAARPPHQPELADLLSDLFDAVLTTWRWDEGIVL